MSNDFIPDGMFRNQEYFLSGLILWRFRLKFFSIMSTFFNLKIFAFFNGVLSLKNIYLSDNRSEKSQSHKNILFLFIRLFNSQHRLHYCKKNVNSFPGRIVTGYLLAQRHIYLSIPINIKPGYNKYAL